MGSVQQRNPPALVIVSFVLTSILAATDGQIRLVSSARCSGRVEIYYQGTWGTVCDDSWDMNDAKVVCRELNCGTALTAPHSASFGRGSGKIWLDDVECAGNELSLTECQHREFGTHDCGHNEDASVMCSGVPIRLSGSTLCSGRVEIYHNNVWGTVCDDSWDLEDATVVCRELGCGEALQVKAFGAGTGEIWLDEVGCSGSEKSITQCTHGGFGKHDCGHGEDIGVVCSAILQKPRIFMNPAVGVVWGQDVSITCSLSTLSGQLIGATFVLENTLSSFRKTQQTSTNSATFHMPDVNLDNEGLYQCQYTTSVSGQNMNSVLSTSVNLAVTVILPKPNIAIVPGDVVAWGQDADISCSIPTSHFGGTFILETTSGSFRETQTSTNNFATFNISQVDFDNQGSYQCQYRMTGLNQNFTSPKSDSATLSVAVPMQQPNISLASPNWGLVWGPDGAGVTRGYSFVVTCSTSSPYPGGVFHLNMSGSSQPTTKPAVNHSASFHFHAAEDEHWGKYSCVYEVELSGRKFVSNSTASVNVFIKRSLLPLVFMVVGPPLLLVLLVMVVVVLVYKRRQTRRRHEVFVAMTVQPGKDEGKCEDDAALYENVNPMDTKKNPNDKGNEYVESESSDDDDYVNEIKPSDAPTADDEDDDENIYQNT